MEADLHITNRCNLKCKHCVYDSGSLNMPDMALDTVKTLANGFKKMGINEIHITGGEPLLNKDFFVIASYLRSKGFRVRMQTNGMVVTNDIAKKVKETGIEYVLISIDGTKDFHNSFRKSKLSFDKAVKAVEIFKSAGVPVGVTTVLCKDNVSEIEKTIELVNSLHADQHSFFYLTPNGRGKNIKENILSLEEWKNVKSVIENTLKKLNCKHKIRIQDVYKESQKQYGKNQVNKFSTCRNDNCLVLSNGDVYHCVLFVHTQYSLGNIYKQDIFDIWQNYKSTIEKIKSKNKILKIYSEYEGGCLGLINQLTDKDELCKKCNVSQGLVSNCIRKYI